MPTHHRRARCDQPKRSLIWRHLDQLGTKARVEQLRLAYTCGFCWDLALALHDHYGLEMVGLAPRSEPLHVGCRLPDGRIVDIEGVHSEQSWEALWREREQRGTRPLYCVSLERERVEQLARCFRRPSRFLGPVRYQRADYLEAALEVADELELLRGVVFDLD